jgi:hypothetical protein
VLLFPRTNSKKLMKRRARGKGRDGRIIDIIDIIDIVDVQAS